MISYCCASHPSTFDPLPNNKDIKIRPSHSLWEAKTEKGSRHRTRERERERSSLVILQSIDRTKESRDWQRALSNINKLPIARALAILRVFSPGICSLFLSLYVYLLKNFFNFTRVNRWWRRNSSFFFQFFPHFPRTFHCDRNAKYSGGIFNRIFQSFAID